MLVHEFAAVSISRRRQKVTLLVLTASLFAAGGSLRATTETQSNILTAHQSQPSSARVSPVEQFKSFISSPPVVSNLVWEEKVPMDGGLRPSDGSIARSTKFDCFQGRWQTNGLFFRRLGSRLDVTNFVAYQLVSWCLHKHAVLYRNLNFVTWDDRDASIPKTTASLFDTSGQLYPLRQVLNLGIMYAGIGTVRWNGTNFQTECQVASKPALITGSVVPSETGPPMAMFVTYAYEHRTNEYVIRYGYATGKANFMPPVAITNFWRGTYQEPRPETELGEWRILDFQPATGTLPPEALDVAPYVERNQSQWMNTFYTNGIVYYVTKKGTTNMLYALNDIKATSRTTPLAGNKMNLVYACWGCMNIAIFALMVRAKEVTKNKLQNERNNTL